MSSQPENSTGRLSSRRRTLKAGVIAYSGRHVTLHCTIRDLSDGGARLLVTGTVEAPDTFELIIEIDALEVPCAVMWRRGMEIGVKFTAPPRRREKKRLQVIDQWAQSTAKPTLRRQAKPVT